MILMFLAKAKKQDSGAQPSLFGGPNHLVHVKPHQRHTASGAVVQVAAHDEHRQGAAAPAEPSKPAHLGGLDVDAAHAAVDRAWRASKASRTTTKESDGSLHLRDTEYEPGKHAVSFFEKGQAHGSPVASVDPNGNVVPGAANDKVGSAARGLARQAIERAKPNELEQRVAKRWTDSGPGRTVKHHGGRTTLHDPAHGDEPVATIRGGLHSWHPGPVGEEAANVYNAAWREHDDATDPFKVAAKKSGPGNWKPLLDMFAAPGGSQASTLGRWLDKYARTGEEAHTMLSAWDEASIHGVRSLDRIADNMGLVPIAESHMATSIAKREHAAALQRQTAPVSGGRDYEIKPGQTFHDPKGGQLEIVATTPTHAVVRNPYAPKSGTKTMPLEKVAAALDRKRAFDAEYESAPWGNGPPRPTGGPAPAPAGGAPPLGPKTRRKPAAGEKHQKGDLTDTNLYVLHRETNGGDPNKAITRVPNTSAPHLRRAIASGHLEPANGKDHKDGWKLSAKGREAVGEWAKRWKQIAPDMVDDR